MNEHPRRPGRPPLDRDALYELLNQQPRVGRRMVRANERKLANVLGCHRATVGRALVQLEADGRLRRFRSAGPRGVTVILS